jgi:hypothetical protein
MEAHLFRAAILAGVILSLGASHRTENFIVDAPTPELAAEFGQAAEKFRKELAIEWLGRELPRWREPCPISTTVGPEVGAGGATQFMFDRDRNGQPVVFGWTMSVQGSRERILDSVLPHEVTHTIFATHFKRPLPRWADEGGSTTVEHVTERAKQHAMLITFLKTSRGIPFDQMFAMREYPRDIMPLYAQGYATARFLIAQGGKREFVKFIGSGFEREDWAGAIKKHYGYEDLAALQTAWLGWIREGGPNTVPAKFSGRPANSNVVLASNTESPSQTAPAHEATATPVNALASAAPATHSKSAKSAAPGNGWYARASRGEVSYNAPSGQKPTTLTSHEATHPQPVEPARQVILEWNRAPGTAAPQVPPPQRSAGGRTDTVLR